jgi:hypothetical protein
VSRLPHPPPGGNDRPRGTQAPRPSVRKTIFTLKNVGDIKTNDSLSTEKRHELAALARQRTQDFEKFQAKAIIAMRAEHFFSNKCSS